MEITSAHFALYVFAIFFNEFAWKAGFEAWHQRIRLHTFKESIRAYGVYRLCVLVSHGLLIGLLFRAPFSHILIAAIVLSLLGCSELLFAGVSNWVYARIQRTLRPLHLIYIALLTAGMVAFWIGYTWQPGVILTFLDGLNLSETVRSQFLSGDAFIFVLVFFLASIPANYAVRWLVNKPHDATFADTIMAGALTSLTGYAVPGEQLSSATQDAPSDGPTLQGGRIIGVLERCIVIALFARGEIAAIGFVFTAKSIVRYHDFSKPDFAEYYLIGTLYSVVIALALSLLL